MGNPRLHVCPGRHGDIPSSSDPHRPASCTARHRARGGVSGGRVYPSSPRVGVGAGLPLEYEVGLASALPPESAGAIPTSPHVAKLAPRVSRTTGGATLTSIWRRAPERAIHSAKTRRARSAMASQPLRRHLIQSSEGETFAWRPELTPNAFCGRSIALTTSLPPFCRGTPLW
jgi:hypothetical protein